MESKNALLYYFKGSQIIEGERVIECTDLNNGMFGKKKGFALITNLRVFIYPTGNANQETIIECKHISKVLFQEKKGIHIIKKYFTSYIDLSIKMVSMLPAAPKQWPIYDLFAVILIFISYYLYDYSWIV